MVSKFLCLSSSNFPTGKHLGDCLLRPIILLTVCVCCCVLYIHLLRTKQQLQVHTHITQILNKKRQSKSLGYSYINGTIDLHCIILIYATFTVLLKKLFYIQRFIYFVTTSFPLSRPVPLC